MSNLLNSIKDLATNELVSKVASSLGENEGTVSKGLTSIIPTILSGVMNTSSSNHSVLGDLLSVAGKDNNMIGNIIGGLTSGSNDGDGNIGGSIINMIFGNKSDAISNIISNVSGMKSGSSNSLMSIGASLVASFLGKKMIGEGLNIGGIMNWLGGHKNEINSALPSGFSSLMGGDMSNLTSSASNATSKTAKMATEAISQEKDGGMKWLIPVILLGLLGVGIWYWMKGCNKDESSMKDETTAILDSAGNSISNAANVAANEIDNMTDSAKAAVSNGATALAGKLDEAGNWIASKGEPIKIKLDNGIEIDATKGSLEDKLFSFIKDPASVAGKDVWFNFEDLLFETGKSTLKASSAKQLENAVAILKAYPAVKVKLGGYTDNSGDSLANVKLSDARAKTVYNQLLNKGVAKTSFDEKAFEGYGPQFPIGDNNTPEGKAQNRRISISVRAK